MAVYSIYFSPTGGTLRVMDLLTAGEPQVTRIDLTDPDCDYKKFRFGEGDVCWIGVPAYGGRVPGHALLRLGEMQGGGAAAVLVSVYGNRAFEDTLLELKTQAAACGFRPVAAVAAVAEHSIVRQFAKGRPDQRDAQQLAGFAAEIKRRLEAPASGDLEVPGNFPHREYHGAPVRPSAGKGCNRCGVCAAQCPVGAIPKEDPSQTDPGACISCMRCVSVCPQKARDIGKAALFIATQKLGPACRVRKENELF